MATLSQIGKATNIGIGMLHPKQQNRFRVRFNSPSLTEEEQLTLSSQTVKFEDQWVRDDQQDFIEITFQDDVANTLLEALRGVSDIADSDDLTIEVQLMDGNEEVLCTWYFFEARLEQMHLGKLDYATGEPVWITGMFEYSSWDLVLRGEEVSSE